MEMSRLLASDMPARRMAAPPPPSLPLSDAIGLSRLICILGIVYVHGWTGLGGDQMAIQAGSPQDVMRWTIVELFGRSAVPLLSIISGWLVAHSVTKRSYRTFVGGKARAILMPMLLWNLIVGALVVGASTLHIIRAPLLGDARWVIDNLFNLTRAGDINVQMAFLRDLFLCMLAAPLLVKLTTRVLAVVGVVAGVWMIGAWTIPLLLRPSILLFFVLGMLIRRHELASRLGAIAWWQAALPFLLIAPVKVLMSIWGHGSSEYHTHLLAAVDLTMRGTAALLVWRAAIGLAQTRPGHHMLKLEAYAFFLFCSHLLFMWFAGPAIGNLTGPMGSRWWPIYFLLQPLLALGFAVALAEAIKALSPAAAKLLSGGRLDGRRRRDAQTASPAARPLAHAH